MAVRVTDVLKDSIAQKSDIKPGDSVISINGSEINDMLDLQFYSTCDDIVINIQSCVGENRTVSIKKEEYQPLGLEFETYLIDKQHFCKNKCIFCFIDQLPSGLRESLYFKDDDERLSFLFGNYITLTNLTQKEIDRIKRVKISPINISVHATSPDVRVRMMKNPKAAEVVDIMTQLAKAGIRLNCQIVLCKGVNDKKELERTINDLQKLYPAVQSVSIVPIGVTKYRDNLPELMVFDAADCKMIIEDVKNLTEDFYAKNSKRLIYLSDEFYLKAKEEIPSKEYYDEFLQIENGVGMVRTFMDGFIDELEYQPKLRKIVKADIATGEGFYPVLNELIKKAKNILGDGLDVKVHSIKNDFFGGNVNVAGLLTGQDIIRQLDGKMTSKRLILTKDVLRREGDMLLDNKTPTDIEKALNINIEFYSNDGYELLLGIIKGGS